MSIAHVYPPGTHLGDELRTFTSDDYQKMAAVGIFDAEEGTELVRGLVYDRDSTSILPRRFTVDEYHKLAEVGVLHPDERLELIDGVIYRMSPIGSRHAKYVELITDLFYELYKTGASIRVQSPILLPDFSEPEPDLVLLRPRRGRYARQLPQPTDVLLLVEVMDTSALRDRGQKLNAYAKAGIPEVWLVDVADQTVEVYTEPADHVYGRSTVRHVGQALAPTACPDRPLPVASIFAPAEDEDATDSPEAPAP